jgi:superfamily II DNA or RNA helicase
MNSGAQRRYGFSGTPLRDSEIDDMKLIGATGPIIYDQDAGTLIDQGLAAKPKILMVVSDAVIVPDITEDVAFEAEQQKEREEKKRKRSKGRKRVKPVAEPNKYRIAYRLGIMHNEAHNAAVVRAAQWMVDQGRKTLLLCRYKEHYDILAGMLEEAGTKYIGVWGATDNLDRDHAKEALGDGRVSLVLATGIWDEGEDIPGVNGLVFAEGVAANTNSRQRVGRGMRGDTDDVWVIDFVPTCEDTLREHAAKRAEAWEGEGYEVLVWTEWPKSARATIDLPFERWDEEVAEVACENAAALLTRTRRCRYTLGPW